MAIEWIESVHCFLAPGSTEVAPGRVVAKPTIARCAVRYDGKVVIVEGQHPAMGYVCELSVGGRTVVMPIPYETLLESFSHKPGEPGPVWRVRLPKGLKDAVEPGPDVKLVIP